jgi:hypothetical protein
MRKHLAFAALIVLAGKAGAQSPVDKLGWLAGCWQQARPNGLVEEQWMSPRGGAMLGMSRTVRADKVSEYEHLRIYAAGDTLVYDAQPSGQARTQFKTVTASADEIIFANPQHDFPQRVAYKRVGKDSLVARIEGSMNGQNRVIPFPYKRVACP